MKAFLLLAMVFLHIIADFQLQGILASFKKKEWWVENAPEPLYKHDYIISLFMHSFFWTFAIMLPLFFDLHFKLNAGILVAFVINVIIHCVVDDLKANKHKINLVQDQLAHIAQMVITWGIFEILVDLI